MFNSRKCSAAVFLWLMTTSAAQVFAQSFGAEMHNTLMPASGGMAGASVARPQDLQSAINGNPASLSQFLGTQFSFSGAWAEPTYRVEHAGGVLPNVGAFSAKSEAQGAALGNIGVIQDFRPMGIPATIGIGMIAGGGGGVSFRDEPASNGTSAALQAIEISAGAGLNLTDRLSLGANIMLGNAGIDGPFVGLTAWAYDYALRGSIGLTYDLGCNTTFGVYYQTRQQFNFDDAVRLDLPGPGPTIIEDIDLDLPRNVCFGIAHDSLMCGKLLVAVDVLYKQWSEADLFQAIYDDQWVVQVGMQYQWSPRVRLRAGYTWAENAMLSNPSISAGGVTPPGAQAAIEYIQAQFAAINEHRISFGVGIKDILPNVDLDFLVGGMFEESENFGPFSSASVESYWIGTGVTWRFGGACGEEAPTTSNASN